MKLFKTLLFGFATGVAATYFLKNKQGQAVKEKCLQEVDAFKANPAGYQEAAKEKVLAYKDAALSRFQDLKGSLESGDLNVEHFLANLREKAEETTDFLEAKKDDLLSQQEKVVDNVTMAEVDDIVIDYGEAISEVESSKEV